MRKTLISFAVVLGVTALTAGSATAFGGCSGKTHTAQSGTETASSAQIAQSDGSLPQTAKPETKAE